MLRKPNVLILSTVCQLKYRFAMKKTIFSPQNTKLVDWLKKNREAQGLSMRALAAKLERPHSFVERVEHQERRLDVCEFITYCEALNVDPVEAIHLIRNTK